MGEIGRRRKGDGEWGRGAIKGERDGEWEREEGALSGVFKCFLHLGLLSMSEWHRT
jgi:hypothetical protein